MSTTLLTQPARDADSSLATRFDRPLPRGLRREADGMTTEAFLARYSPTSGPLRLGTWQCVDDERPAAGVGPRPIEYQATITVGDRICTSKAAASGPIAALTAMLHGRGVAVEIAAFHQLPADGGTATFIYGIDGINAEWAMGWSDDAVESALRAMIACANRLFEKRC